MSKDVAFLSWKIYNKMENERNEGAFMRENNRQPRKISDGRKSNNFMKYAKRFVKNMKRAWRRNVKPAIYATFEMLADKIAGLKNQSKVSNAEQQTRSEQRAMSKKRRRRKVMRIKIASIGIALIVAVTSIAVFAHRRKEEKIAKEKAAIEKVIKKADRQAAMYDYDKAVKIIEEFIKENDKYKERAELLESMERYETEKASCEPYPIDQITHIFFHVMIQNADEAFGPDSQMPDGLNIYMATMEELDKVINSMYEKGYVMVSLSDVAPATTDEDGNTTFSEGQIMLPPGKKAFVLSQDDVCYYHSYEHSGMAEKLVIDKNGDVKTQYTNAQGETEIGVHDMVPYIDEFVDKHPDFSYRGAKGILALTGYNGILGYRTDPTYNETKDRDHHQQAWLDAHPDFDYEKECEEATKVAEALKKDGWEFASHSWGHMWQTKLSDEGFDVDAKKWMERVSPLIGGTNIWIYSNGEDVDYPGYEHRFETLRNYGFQYFCPVNSNLYSTEIKESYVKQGRRNIDGYRMYYDMINDETDRLSDLFDVDDVFDKKRPTPVPEI